MRSTFRKSLAAHILNASLHEPQPHRFERFIATVLGMLVMAGLIVLLGMG